MSTLRIATRGSELALWQAKYVASRVKCDTQIVVVSTRGDKDQDSPISVIGGQGIFVKEVQAALLEGRADVAVHSAKDLPASETDGLSIAAFPPRGDVRDALVGKRLDQLGGTDVIATGSIRRQVQIRALRPDLKFVPLRGNMARRISLAESHGAVVVAYAALERLGRASEAVQVFEPDEIIPQVGQGALAVECRCDDSVALGLLEGIDDQSTRRAVVAERSLLSQLGSGCSLPVGAYAREEGGTIVMFAFLAASDGSSLARVSGTGRNPGELGTELGRRLLSEVDPKVLKELGIHGRYS